MTKDNKSQPPPIATTPAVSEAECQQLVAYLDGEIEGATRARIEQRLGTDSEYRRRLVELEQSWNLLDSLPLAEADAKFTESTVTMAAAAVQDSRRWSNSRRWWLAALAAAVGFVLVGGPLIAQRRSRLRDVPVIHNLDLYLHADSIEFLQMLADEGVFAEVDDDVL